MTKLYPCETPEQKDGLGPSPETITFLLNYSKALHVDDYKHISCELLLN